MRITDRELRRLRTTLPPWTRRGIAIRRLLGIPVLVDPITVWPYYASQDVMFVQIGSRNGLDGDPLMSWTIGIHMVARHHDRASSRTV